jgi:hypothetical protein
MAETANAIPPWERKWRDWVAEGFAVDVGINYLGRHQPDPTYWQMRSTARTLGTTSEPLLASSRWRVVVFRRNQVLLFNAEGTPVRLDLIEFVKGAVQDESGARLGGP